MTRLIHVATIRLPKHGKETLFLREAAPGQYAWVMATHDEEKATDISASCISEALRLATIQWKNAVFTTLKCGTRFTLPERDEHGAPALFYQMAASYSSPNGVYQDEHYGPCLVNHASQDALSLWRKLRSENRL